jgi:hypothetical protein
MWKYILTYMILKSIPCVDEFGRQTSKTCIDKIKMERAFDHRDSALVVLKRAAEQQDLQNFKLDSIPLHQYNCDHPYGSSTARGCIGAPCNTFTCGKCGKQWPIY